MEERGGVVMCLEVAVKFEELWKEGKDECERYLRSFSKVLRFVRQVRLHTRSSNRETKMTRNI